MKTEFIQQYAHTWRVFEGLVGDFDEAGWLHTGRGAITPARLAFHILQSAKGYLEDTTPIGFVSGKPFECAWATVKEEDLPSQTDIVACLGELKAKTEAWFDEWDLGAENKAFPWAGKTKLGVALFSLRHTLYHLGELSSLLNESRHGNVEDNYAKAV